MFLLLLPDISNDSRFGIFFQPAELKGDRNLTFRPSSLEEIAYLSRESERKVVMVGGRWWTMGEEGEREGERFREEKGEREHE